VSLCATVGLSREEGGEEYKGMVEREREAKGRGAEKDGGSKQEREET
jgi:hypothetical protein